MWIYLKILYFAKLEDIQEMNELLDVYALPKLKEGYTNNFHRPVTSSKIKAITVKHTKSIVHHDQVGFISDIQRWLNMCKSISVIHSHPGIASMLV